MSATPHRLSEAMSPVSLCHHTHYARVGPLCFRLCRICDAQSASFLTAPTLGSCAPSCGVSDNIAAPLLATGEGRRPVGCMKPHMSVCECGGGRVRRCRLSEVAVVVCQATTLVHPYEFVIEVSAEMMLPLILDIFYHCLFMSCRYRCCIVFAGPSFK